MFCDEVPRGGDGLADCHAGRGVDDVRRILRRWERVAVVTAVGEEFETLDGWLGNEKGAGP